MQRRFRFLEPALVRDADGRRPNHPEYDERTLTVPKDMKLSPSQRQYWSIKSQYRDVILFFKVGKFYELYERDAEIGCAELDWKMTVSGVGHCRQVGCPEAGVDAAVARLVHLGYKVGRIEQLENAAQAKARGGSGAVIRRELAEVATPATRTDGDVRIDASAPVEAVHVLAFVEEEDERGVNRGEDGTSEADDERLLTDDTSSVTVGYAFLDAAAGTLSIGSLRDDEHRVALATLLAQVAPAEVLVTRGRVSDAARREIVKCVSKPTVTALTPGDEFPIDPSQSDAILSADISNTEVTTAHPSARACAAAIKSHLRRLNCERAVTSACVAKHDVYAGGRVRMDAATLANLELLCGSEGTKEGSLLARIECGCATDAGRRLLRRWISAPMIDVGRHQTTAGRGVGGGGRCMRRRGRHGRRDTFDAQGPGLGARGGTREGCEKRLHRGRFTTAPREAEMPKTNRGVESRAGRGARRLGHSPAISNLSAGMKKRYPRSCAGSSTRGIIRSRRWRRSR